MLRRKKHPKMGIKKGGAKLRSPSHRKWIRQTFECLNYAKLGCDGEIECAHVRMGTDGGIGLKPSDVYCVPLCRACHARSHKVGEKSFWKAAGIDPLKIAKQLADKSPALRKLRAVEAQLRQELEEGE